MKHRPIPCLRPLVVASLLLTGGAARAESGEEVVISAQVFNGYKRTKLADGTFKPERFALAEGTHWKGRKIDQSLDTMPFTEIARTIAGPLRKQGYLPTADPKQTDLLILVSWGVTTGATEGDYDRTQPALFKVLNEIAAAKASGGETPPGTEEALASALAVQQMENRLRGRNNFKNAEILGYTESYDRAQEWRNRGIEVGDITIDELEANRYFVVLKAFDFPHLQKQKKLKLLWEARFSIYEHRNNFDQQLLAMTQAASRYFGQHTKGLVHRVDIPEGKIEYGEPIVIEMVASPVPDDQH